MRKCPVQLEYPSAQTNAFVNLLFLIAVSLDMFDRIATTGTESDTDGELRKYLAGYLKHSEDKADGVDF
ncbi:hypothetical protein KIN20_019868 [Parelaphostrongylus tenuis]|uniref:Uncharacterized protein n=1 Tax=Parelaphostrongylus tenuis TaxID=148309 RepID=A0AAD5N2N7_PARTN|nr:hypothetical protein KIN20_019868 [Parelaphostrongylus tenuis]